MNLCMAEINHVLLSCIDQGFIVHVDGALRNSKERALTDEVFEKEIAEVICSCQIKGKLVWKERPSQRLIAILWRIVQTLNHMRFL